MSAVREWLNFRSQLKHISMTYSSRSCPCSATSRSRPFFLLSFVLKLLYIQDRWPVQWAFASLAAFRHILVFNCYYSRLFYVVLENKIWWWWWSHIFFTPAHRSASASMFQATNWKSGSIFIQQICVHFAILQISYHNNDNIENWLFLLQVNTWSYRMYYGKKWSGINLISWVATDATFS